MRVVVLYSLFSDATDTRYERTCFTDEKSGNIQESGLLKRDIFHSAGLSLEMGGIVCLYA